LSFVAGAGVAAAGVPGQQLPAVVGMPAVQGNVPPRSFHLYKNIVLVALCCATVNKMHSYHGYVYF